MTDTDPTPEPASEPDAATRSESALRTEPGRKPFWDESRAILSSGIGAADLRSRDRLLQLLVVVAAAVLGLGLGMLNVFAAEAGKNGLVWLGLGIAGLIAAYVGYCFRELGIVLLLGVCWIALGTPEVAKGGSGMGQRLQISQLLIGLMSALLTIFAFSILASVIKIGRSLSGHRQTFRYYERRGQLPDSLRRLWKARRESMRDDALARGSWILSSPLNLPIAIFLLSGIWSTVHSLLFPDQNVLAMGPKQFLQVNVIEILLRVLALGSVLMIGNVLTERRLKAAAVMLVIPGVCLVSGLFAKIGASLYQAFPEVVSMAILLALGIHWLDQYLTERKARRKRPRINRYAPVSPSLLAGGEPDAIARDMVASRYGRRRNENVVSARAIERIRARYADAIARFRQTWRLHGIALSAAVVLFAAGLIIVVNAEWVSGVVAGLLSLVIVLFRTRRKWLLIGIALAAVGVLLNFDYFYEKLYGVNFYQGGRMNWGVKTAGPDIGAFENDRTRMLAASVKYATTFPLGIGLGNYRAYNQYYGRPDVWNTTTFTSAHGTFAQALSETGWPGLLSLLWLMAVAARTLWRVYRALDPGWEKAVVLGCFAAVVGNFASSFMGDYLFPTYHNGGMNSFGATVYTWFAVGFGLAIGRVRKIDLFAPVAKPAAHRRPDAVIHRPIESIASPAEEKFA